MNLTGLTPTAPKSPAPTLTREERLAQAADPAPAAAERGPVARMHWRHGLDVDAALASAVVDTPATPREWSALMSETHAALLDPSGLSPLARPSSIGRAVSEALRADPSWPVLADAARAHPLIARETVTGLANVVLDALKSAGAKPETDSRVSASALERCRERLERAREAQRKATTPAERAEALREAVKAQQDAQRAEAATAADEGIAARTSDRIEGSGSALAGLAKQAQERADAAHAWSAALSDGTGVGGPSAVSDDVVRALTPEVVRMLRFVGALRASLSTGRSTRHVRGLEGMIGIGTGGLDRMGDLTSMSLASLGGHLGQAHAALTRLALVEDRADIVLKGGGIARDGHVVVVLDKSGSMTMEAGARETWAGALAIAVILEARKDDRVAALVTYDGSVRHEIVVDSAATLASALQACMEGSGGDNNENSALQAAVRCLKRMPHGGDPADVLMLTDGQWEASNLAGVDLGSARLRGCFIGGKAPVGASFTSTWEVRSAPTVEGNDAALAVEIAASVV